MTQHQKNTIQLVQQSHINIIRNNREATDKILMQLLHP